MNWVNCSDRQTKMKVKGEHPVSVTLDKKIINRDNMTAKILQAGQITGQGGDDRLALACFHLGDPAFRKNGATNQLHIEWTCTIWRTALWIKNAHCFVDRDRYVNLLPRKHRLNTPFHLNGIHGFDLLLDLVKLAVNLLGQTPRIKFTFRVEDITDPNSAIHNFTSNCQRFRLNITDGLAICDLVSKFFSLGTQFRICKVAYLTFKLIDLPDASSIGLNEPRVARTEYFGESFTDIGNYHLIYPRGVKFEIHNHIT